MDDQDLKALWMDHARPFLEADPLPELHMHLYKGIEVWPVFRSAVMLGLLNKAQRAPHGIISPSETTGILDQLKRRLSGGLARSKRTEPPPALLKPSWLPGPDPDVSILGLGNIGPCKLRNGLWFNPHFDSLFKAFEQDGAQTLTYYYNTNPGLGQRFGMPSTGVKNVIDAAIQRAVETPENCEPLRKTLTVALSDPHVNAFKLNLTADFFVQRLQIISEIRWVFARLFSEHPSIRILCLTNYYNPVGWAAIHAAKEANIICVDIQHGLQGPAHHAYAGLHHHRETILPDKFLCWDTVSRDHIAAQIGKDRSHLLGLSCVREIQPQLREAHISPRLKPSLPVVGLFLQYTETMGWLSQLRQAIPDHIVLKVRRHPGAIKLGNLADLPKGCENADTLDMADLLVDLDCVLTGYSSAALEAMQFGLPVLAYSPLAEPMLGPYDQNQNLHLCNSDPNQIARNLEVILEKRGSTQAVLPNIPPIAEVLEWLKSTSA